MRTNVMFPVNRNIFLKNRLKNFPKCVDMNVEFHYGGDLLAAEYIGVKELAEKWGVTTRRINRLCVDGYFSGAYKKDKFWMVPSDAEKPSVLRAKKANKVISRTRTTKLLPCPVGITSYKEVSRECYYVDKTLLIKDIIDDHNKVYLFTRPRRFG